MLCSNTIHKISDEIEQAISIPLIHVVDANARQIKKMALKKVGLLGTRFTMKERFYKERLERMHGLQVVILKKTQRTYIHNAIYTELAKGILLESTKETLLHIIFSLQEQDAEGIILGCTELPLLIKEEDVNIPIFNTLTIHLKAAVEFALNRR
ncbi:MAG: putative racemase [Promethearchaeota archaeon]|nr:MAG: putative racemase [Candidatus Lokiarchaeota archaeon]